MIKSYIFYMLHFGIIFLSNIYIANYYLAELFGEYQFYTTLFAFLSAFSQMGTMQSFTVFAPRTRSSEKLIFATLILRGFGYLSISLILLILFYILQLPNIAFIFLIQFLPLTLNLSSILDYYHKTSVDVKYNFIFDGALFTVLVMSITELDGQIVYVVLARAFTKSFAELMKYRYIVNNIGKFHFSKLYLKWFYLKSRIFILNRVIVELYSKSEILLLGAISTHKDVGIYAVAYTIYNAILMGEGLLSRKLFPRLTKSFKNSDEMKKVLNLSIIYKSIYFLSAIFATYFILNKIIFTYFYDGSEYLQSSEILNLMLIGLLSHIFASNTNFLLMLKDKYLYLTRFSIGVLLNISLGYIFFNLYNLEGYTVAIQIVKVVMVMYSVYISYKYLSINSKEGI